MKRLTAFWRRKPKRIGLHDRCRIDGEIYIVVNMSTSSGGEASISLLAPIHFATRYQVSP